MISQKGAQIHISWKTCEEISEAIDDIQTLTTDPSHIIAEVCCCLKIDIVEGHRRMGTIFLGGAEVILPECDVTKNDVISLPTSNVY